MGCKLLKTAAVSANQHQSSSSKDLVKCYILCDMSVEKFFIFRKDLWKCVHVCEWNNLCFVYSAEECIKDREVVPTDLVNKVKKTSNLIICLRSRSSVSSRGTFGKKVQVRSISCYSPLLLNQNYLIACACQSRETFE